MSNFRLKKISILDSFRFGLFYGASISIILFVLLFLYTIIKSIVKAFGPPLFINLLATGIINLFFYLILFAFCTLLLSGLFALLAYIYNNTIDWFGGIELEFEQLEGQEPTNAEEESASTTTDQDSSNSSQSII